MNSKNYTSPVALYLILCSAGHSAQRTVRRDFAIQVGGLAQRLHHTSDQSGGGHIGRIDSTLALLVCVKTFDKLGLSREGIVGATMPGFGTTNRTYNNALALMKSLGVSIREIDIKAACIQHLKTSGTTSRCTTLPTRIRRPENAHRY